METADTSALNILTIGVDEAGRGSLAGPVFAAAVILPDVLDLPYGVVIRDSKRMTPLQRDRSREFIERHAVAWGVGHASVECIDAINILNATHVAMHSALDSLVSRLPVEDLGRVRIRVDGDRFRTYVSHSHGVVNHECVVRGDVCEPAIAAASILAKTHRDEYIVEHMHHMHPEFEWDVNKGYGTSRHLASIRAHGARTAMHRMSFAPCRQFLTPPPPVTPTTFAFRPCHDESD